MQLETLMNTYYDDLNNNDRNLLKQITANKQHYQHLLSEEIAQECHVSRATLLRLCRKIGLQSFSELKYLLKEEEQKKTLTSFNDICEDYHLMIQALAKIDFQTICEKIYKANTIYVYGTGNEQKSLAQELKRIFLTVGKCVVDLFDYGEIQFSKRSFKENDIFIIISLSGNNTDGINIVKSISPFIKTLSITRLENNPISSLCDDSLYATTQVLEGIEILDYELVGIFYTLLDLLFMNYVQYTEDLENKRGRL